MINIPINHNRWAIKHRNGEMKIFFSSLFLICIKCLRPENELVWLGRLVTKRVGLRVFFVVVFLGEGGIRISELLYWNIVVIMLIQSKLHRIYPHNLFNESAW